MIGATAIGLLLAILIDQRIRAEALWRTIYLYPLAISFVVTGTVWRWLLSPSLMFQRGQMAEGAAAAMMILFALLLVLVPYTIWSNWRQRREASRG